MPNGSRFQVVSAHTYKDYARLVVNAAVNILKSLHQESWRNDCALLWGEVTWSIHSLNHFNWQSQTNSFLQSSTASRSLVILEKTPLGSLVSLFSDKRITRNPVAPLQNTSPLLHLKIMNFSNKEMRHAPGCLFSNCTRYKSMSMFSTFMSN